MLPTTPSKSLAKTNFTSKYNARKIWPERRYIGEPFHGTFSTYMKLTRPSDRSRPTPIYPQWEETSHVLGLPGPPAGMLLYTCRSEAKAKT